VLVLHSTEESFEGLAANEVLFTKKSTLEINLCIEQNGNDATS